VPAFAGVAFLVAGVAGCDTVVAVSGLGFDSSAARAAKLMQASTIKDAV
jgi:hypothetical protein